jgi:hypothetical protein
MTSIVILEGGRRTPRADILKDNKEAGLFARFSTTQLGGMAVRATLARTLVDASLVGHCVMGMAQHSHRDSIYGAKGMAWRGGLTKDVPALTVARICGSGAEAIAVGAEIISANFRHDEARPFTVVGGAESMQYPFCLYNWRGKKVGEAVQKYGPIDTKSLASGTHLQPPPIEPNNVSPWSWAKVTCHRAASKLRRDRHVFTSPPDRVAQISNLSPASERSSTWVCTVGGKSTGHRVTSVISW